MTATSPLGKVVLHSTDSCLDELRQMLGTRQRLAFVNGCFDLFHAGHERCLREAASFDLPLIVAINADEYMRRVKHREQAQSAEVRAARIAALPFVSRVLVFDEDTPARVIARLRPAVIVKGPEYAGVHIAEARTIESVGAKVVICRDRKMVSSTELANELARQMDQAARVERPPLSTRWRQTPPSRL